jgi:hypothetical protein
MLIMRQPDNQERGEDGAARRDTQKDWWEGETKEREIAVRLKAKGQRPL